jgi:hypothetical protein
LGRALVVGGEPAAAAAALKRGRARAAELAAGRAPTPEVRTVVEGSTDAASVIERLGAAGGDPATAWAAAFPAAAGAVEGWAGAAAWATATRARAGLAWRAGDSFPAWCADVGVVVGEGEDGGI